MQTLIFRLFHHSHKKRKDSLETRAKSAVRRPYVENLEILLPILLYRASKCKQTKEQGSGDCLWTHIFTSLCGYCQPFSFFCQDADKAGSNCVIIGYNLSKKHNLALHETQIEEPNYVDHKFFLNILLGPTCAKTWAQISKYYRTGWLVGGIIV